LIAELHHGRAWAESVLNVGSTFHFTVPFARVPTPPGPPPPAPAKLVGA